MNIKFASFGENRISLQIPFDRNIISGLKKISGCRWHADKKVWSLPDVQTNLDALLNVICENGIKECNTNYNDCLNEKSTINENSELSAAIWKEIRIRAYSRRTGKMYVQYNEEFLKYSGKNADRIVQDDVTCFLNHLAADRNAAASTLNCVTNALRFYYGNVLKKKFIYEIPRAKKDKKLPVVLSKEEVKRLINAAHNEKHRLILSIAYSAGLRVSEIVNLKISDIDFDRQIINIKAAKGKKTEQHYFQERLKN